MYIRIDNFIENTVMNMEETCYSETGSILVADLLTIHQKLQGKLNQCNSLLEQLISRALNRETVGGSGEAVKNIKLPCQKVYLAVDIDTNKQSCQKVNKVDPDSSEELTLLKAERADLEVNLETLLSEEERSVNVGLQERIEELDKEICLASEEIITLKAEKANLEELLAEVRTKKIVIEEQKEGFEQDLNSANVKLKLLTEESNILMEKLLAAQSHVHDNVQIALDLQTKIDRLEASLGEYTTGIETLQLKLTEESNRSTHLETFGDSLKAKCVELQEKCDILSEELKALQASHRNAENINQAKRKQDESLHKETIAKLKEERVLREKELLRRLDFHGVPRDPCLEELEVCSEDLLRDFDKLSCLIMQIQFKNRGYQLRFSVQDALWTLGFFFVIIIFTTMVQY